MGSVGMMETIARLLKKNLGRLLAAVCLLVIAFFAFGYIVVPMVQTATTSVDGSLAAGIDIYRAFFANSTNLMAIGNTLLVGACCVVTCAVVGITMAVYVRFFCHRHRKLVQILLMAPVMIPGVIIVVAFMQLYGESGMATKLIVQLLGLDGAPFAFQGFGGIVLVITYTQYVYFYLNVYTALNYIDANSVEQVKSLGGGPWRVVKDAVLPVVGPALVLSAMTTFVSAIGSYSAPALIGGKFRVLSTQIVLAKTNYDMQLASVEVMVLLVIGIIAVVGSTWLSHRLQTRSNAKATYWDPDVSHLRWGKVLFGVFLVLQFAMVLLPVAVVFYLSFMTTESVMMQWFPTGFTLDNYVQVFTNKRTFQPMANSFTMAGMAVVAVLLCTVPVVYLARKRRRLTTTVLQWMLMLPWCMPASVIAIDLINVFKTPSIFAFGQALIGTYEILPIAYAIMALPLVLNSSKVAIGGIRDNVEDASRSLGAGGIRTFAWVVLPAIVPGILSGAILAFVRSVGEYTMSALLYGVFNRPISVSIVTTMQEYHIGISMAYGSLLIVLCCVLLFVLLLRFDAARFGIRNESSHKGGRLPRIRLPRRFRATLRTAVEED